MEAFFRFTVSLDPTSSKVSITGTDPLPVYIHQGISLISFTLDSAAVAAGAKFPSTPIQWQDGAGQPADLPPWFIMHRHNDENFVLWDFNSNPGPDAFHHNFEVAVSHDGQTFFTPDPVIVNDPPSGT